MKSQRGMVDSYLILYRMSEPTLIKRGQARGCSSADICRRHICLPHDAVWCHPSHHRIVKVRSTSASHPDIPKEPIVLARLPPRWTILAFLRTLVTGTVRSELMCGGCAWWSQGCATW